LLGLEVIERKSLLAAGPVSRILAGRFLQIMDFRRVTRKAVRGADFGRVSKVLPVSWSLAGALQTGH